MKSLAIELEALLNSNESAELLRAVLGSIPANVVIVRAQDGKILHISESMARLVGRHRREMEGLRISQVKRVPTFDEAGQPVPEYDLALLRAMRGETVTGFEVVTEAADGERVPITMTAAPIRNAVGDVVGAIAIAADLRRDMGVERSLRSNEQLFRELADSVPQLVWMADRKGSVYWYNRRWYSYTGMSPEASVGMGWIKAIHPDHANRVLGGVQHSLKTGEPLEETFLMRSAEGHYRWFISRASPCKDAKGRVTRWFGANTDVTEQLEAQELLRTLLKEVSHRVKNSLSIVSGLLTMQARTLPGDAGNALEEASLRVHAVASVHDQLWRNATDSNEIDLQPFLTKLCSSIAKTAPRHKTVARVEPAIVGSERAIPIGLFINELLTNAYKYAYREGEEGEVRIVGTHGPKGRYRLEVSDSGRGLPAGFDPAKAGKSLGMRVIASLAGQLGGELVTRSTDSGASFSLDFPISPPSLDPRRQIHGPSRAGSPKKVSAERIANIESMRGGRADERDGGRVQVAVPGAARAALRARRLKQRGRETIRRL